MKVSVRLLCAGSCLAALLLGQATAAAASSPRVLGTWASGAYVASNPSTTGINAWSAYRGHAAGVAQGGVSFDTWAHVQGGAWAVKVYSGFPGIISLDVPLTVTGTPLSQVSAGLHDSDFSALAAGLAATGRTNIDIRLGWEFNEAGYPWNGQGPAAYVSAFRRISTLLKAQLPTATIDWGADWGPSRTDSTNPFSWYPGDAYVDVIALDAYDHGSMTPVDNATFTKWANAQYGLNNWAAFAATHQKRFAVPEWGLDLRSAGDNVSYMNDMFYWFAAHASKLAYESYFNMPIVGRLQNSLNSPVQMPLGSQAYQSAWSHGAVTAVAFAQQ